MAINPETEYPLQVDAASSEYPFGKPRNVLNDDDTSGTPFDKLWMQDLFGMWQSFLDEAAITPDGDPDEVGDSQYSDAIKKVVASSNSFASHAAIRALTGAAFLSGALVRVNGAGVEGTGTWRVSTAHGLTDNDNTIIVVDVNTYWQRNTLQVVGDRFVALLNNPVGIAFTNGRFEITQAVTITGAKDVVIDGRGLVLFELLWY